ncbi:MAG: DUF4928 family protein [Chloroflexota bacterium]|nr:DUF4928 family protein [Chloroflexota bacterium]
MTPKSTKEAALITIQSWFDALPDFKGSKARGSIAAALVVLEHLRGDYDLDIDAHTARGGAQVRGLTPGRVAEILTRFGEERHFLREGGRTNRGARGAVASLLKRLSPLALEKISKSERGCVLEALQGYLVERVVEYFNRQRLAPSYDLASSTWHAIHEILAKAKEAGKSGAVAQHLVGAKLQLRFPDFEVENNPSSAADEQTGRAGDFQIKDTAFHVTVAPSRDNLFERVKENIRQGLRVYVVVPEERVEAARGYAEDQLPIQYSQITVSALEAFVAQNIDELSMYSHGKLHKGFRALLETYNQRADEVESDKSVLIEIPATLEKLSSS